MKARYEDLRTRKGNQSFLAYQFTVPRFLLHWHYHPEYELTLITAGKGKRMVGDSHEEFHERDLVLIGPQVPHTWVSNKHEKSKHAAIVIQFSEEFIEPLIRYPECIAVRNLLNLSDKGLHFPLADKDGVDESIKLLLHRQGIDRITGLLNLLDHLSRITNVSLSTGSVKPARGTEYEKRINKVCQYIESHTDSANITDAAALVYLSDSAFCKFFKRQTGKTFSDYLNNIKISDACRLLTEGDKTIAEIAHHAGFESLTYFNRVFLRKKGITPSDFRKNH